MPLPPPSPLNPRANLFAQLSHLVQVADFLVERILDLENGQEHIIVMAEQLQADLDRNTAATTAASTAIANEIQQLKTAVGQLSTNQAPTQAQLDQLNASSSRLEAATAQLVADDPAPAPQPQPGPQPAPVPQPAAPAQGTTLPPSAQPAPPSA